MNKPLKSSSHSRASIEDGNSKQTHILGPLLMENGSKTPAPHIPSSDQHTHILTHTHWWSTYWCSKLAQGFYIQVQMVGTLHVNMKVYTASQSTQLHNVWLLGITCTYKRYWKCHTLLHTFNSLRGQFTGVNSKLVVFLQTGHQSNSEHFLVWKRITDTLTAVFISASIAAKAIHMRTCTQLSYTQRSPTLNMGSTNLD